MEGTGPCISLYEHMLMGEVDAWQSLGCSHARMVTSDTAPFSVKLLWPMKLDGRLGHSGRGSCKLEWHSARAYHVQWIVEDQTGFGRAWQSSARKRKKAKPKYRLSGASPAIRESSSVIQPSITSKM